MKHVFAIVFGLACLQAHAAIEWVCSTALLPRAVISAADLPEGAVASGATGALRSGGSRMSKFAVGRLEIQQAYSGQPVLFGGTWLLAVMLPANHPDTREAFATLGVSAEAAERMALSTGLVDRGIRVMQTQSQLIEKVATNPPAVGYTSFFMGGRDVAPCF